ncbi:hypothetical protein EU538_07090 [Candidatus Thorarchaeota archaeon]|nr:MAG: hypothetical protein EU538_07090 [Candidatus Thorarchaeota archaeon]
MLRRRKPSLVLAASVFVLAWLMFAGSASAQAPDDWFGDEHVELYVTLDGQSLTDATEPNPIVIDMENPMTLHLEVDVIGTESVYNLTGAIGFYYQGFRIFTIGIQQNVTQTIPPDVTIPPVEADVDFGSIIEAEISGFPVQLATGTFQAGVDFQYYLEGETAGVDDPHQFTLDFYFNIPSEDVTDVIFTVAGAATAAATVSAAAGFGFNFKHLLDGIQTAHKIRSIQKKTGEIRSLPNLTVIGAMPALFSAVKEMKKKKKDETSEQAEVSEYRLRQRLREVAPDAWPKEKCPRCVRKWNSKEDRCKKCNLDVEQAKREYAEVLVEKVPQAMKVLDKKKSLSVRKLAKKTKSNEYNAGVISAAMVDTGLTEITKVETPLRSFVMNIGGLAFLILTWQQLLGGAASEFQTTLTFVGAALSVAVIIALYFARKTQIEKLQVTIDEGKPMLPTKEELSEVESEEEDLTDEVEDEFVYEGTEETPTEVEQNEVEPSDPYEAVDETPQQDEGFAEPAEDEYGDENPPSDDTGEE